MTTNNRKQAGWKQSLLIGVLVCFVGVMAIGVLPEEVAKNSSPLKAGLVKLAKEEVFDSWTKTQIDQRWYVTEIPESEAALKNIIEALHQQALTPRKTLKHHNPANVIFIWLYVDKETAEFEPFGGEWLAMSRQYKEDSTNEISIASARLKKQLQPPEVRAGLKESVRKEIYWEYFKADQEMMAELLKEFERDESIDVLDRSHEFAPEIEKRLKEKHGITEDRLFDILLEGQVEGFH